MIYYVGSIPFDSNGLRHFRTPGSKNGIRLYQYRDGSLTPLGRIHYGIGEARAAKAAADAMVKTGSRSSSDTNSSSSETVKKTESVKNTTKTSSRKPKNPKKMTDAELDAEIRDLQRSLERINKERRYEQLMRDVNGRGNSSDKRSFNLGKSLAWQILRPSIQAVGTQLTTYALSKGANALMEAVTGEQGVVRIPGQQNQNGNQGNNQNQNNNKNDKNQKNKNNKK